MKFSFPKSIRLRRRCEYQRLASFDRRHHGRYVIVELKFNPRQITRLGVTVSRRYGSASLRNRFKRIVREAFRLSKNQLKSGWDVNVKPRSAALTATTQDIQHELVRFIV